jgi:hypothetical protein
MKFSMIGHEKGDILIQVTACTECFWLKVNICDLEALISVLALTWYIIYTFSNLKFLISSKRNAHLEQDISKFWLFLLAISCHLSCTVYSICFL